MATASDYAESFLTRALADVRKHLDEPTVIAKYSDAELIRQLELSYILVVGEKNRNALNPAVATVTVTLAASTTEYILPYTVGSIEAIYEGDAGGSKIFYSSRGGYSPLGRFLWIEGNTFAENRIGMAYSYAAINSRQIRFVPGIPFLTGQCREVQVKFPLMGTHHTSTHGKK